MSLKFKTGEHGHKKNIVSSFFSLPGKKISENIGGSREKCFVDDQIL